ncbi:hypothetical protein [Bacillus sp. MUM 116]|uniref:hypothetical protein n=1 Tax=Bacillus sp. MUM 116 TaxID=1678002 RepID=UPI0015A67025|nr:hypothetical protein [Bacillus sp. MUM 116]
MTDIVAATSADIADIAAIAGGIADLINLRGIYRRDLEGIFRIKEKLISYVIEGV